MVMHEHAVATAKPIITEVEAAPYVGMSRAWLRTARRQGRGPAYIRDGRAIRYRIADLDAYLRAHRVEPRAQQFAEAG